MKNLKITLCLKSSGTSVPAVDAPSITILASERTPTWGSVVCFCLHEHLTLKLRSIHLCAWGQNKVLSWLFNNSYFFQSPPTSPAFIGLLISKGNLCSINHIPGEKYYFYHLRKAGAETRSRFMCCWVYLSVGYLN